ncbi:MAG: hypothetical protein WBD58_06380 [Geitlerinemataceae cyanobacterium]
MLDNLIEGIKLINDNNMDCKNRILLSCGTEKASIYTDRSSIPYYSEAIVPRLPWREPTAAEQQILLSRKFNNVSDFYIKIISIPYDILYYFNAIRILQNSTILEEELKKVRYKKGINLMEKYLETFRLHNASFTKYGIGCNHPKQRTVTIGVDNCRVGLHIDNPLNSSLYRILVNIGSEARYFLFINLSIYQLYNWILKIDSNGVNRTSGSSRIAQLFMGLYPNYPVVKLRVNPGEAYIAPTEHIAHDGCTEDSNCLDIFFTMRTIFNDYHL